MLNCKHYSESLRGCWRCSVSHSHLLSIIFMLLCDNLLVNCAFSSHAKLFHITKIKFTFKYDQTWKLSNTFKFTGKISQAISVLELHHSHSSTALLTFSSQHWISLLKWTNMSVLQVIADVV